jgi:MFS family permease
MAVMTVVAAPLSGRIVGRRGPRLPLLISGVSLVTASALLTGIDATSRQFGQTLGVAVVGAIVTSRVGASVHADLSSASHAAWWTLTACGGVVLVLGSVATSRRANESARRTAAELNPEALAA